MVSKNEKKVIANALEVYIQTLRGMSVETAMKCRPSGLYDGKCIQCSKAIIVHSPKVNMCKECYELELGSGD
jgi:hypothetical protein